MNEIETFPVYSPKDEYLDICKKNIKRDGLDELLNWLEISDFFIAPASTKFHGNYEGGLCEHSLNVYRQLDRLNKMYHTGLSDETIAVSALFHDICKVNFYKKVTKPVKSKDGKWSQKEVWEIDEKAPLGHGEKSCIILQWYIKLTMEELLAIRWHMGGFDCAVKGGDYSLNRAQDVSPLVTLLSVADMISSNLLEEKREN